jgi:ketosteroid isomerase-like protein
MAGANEAETVFRAVLAAAFERHDAQAAAAHFAENGVVVDHGDGGTEHRGRAAIVALIQGFLDLLPDAVCEVTDLVVDGDRLAAATVIRGRLEGEATEVRLAVFDVVRDGRIVSEHIYGSLPAA